MSDATEWEISGPHHKDEQTYLKPTDWCGDPVSVEDEIVPYGLGGTCWYYIVKNPQTGGRRGFAAETPERAESAARQWMDEL